MLNLPTLIEHNNDYNVNGIILRRLPPKSSNQCVDKKKKKIFQEKTWASGS